MKDRKTTLLLLLLLLSLTGTAQEKLLPRATPAEMGMDASTLARCDSAITAAIADTLLPGGVLAVVRDGKWFTSSPTATAASPLRWSR